MSLLLWLRVGAKVGARLPALGPSSACPQAGARRGPWFLTRECETWPPCRARIPKLGARVRFRECSAAIVNLFPGLALVLHSTRFFPGAGRSHPQQVAGLSTAEPRSKTFGIPTGTHAFKRCPLWLILTPALCTASHGIFCPEGHFSSESPFSGRLFCEQNLRSKSWILGKSGPPGAKP